MSHPANNSNGIVIVAGAGICGLATALAVASRGRRVHVLEARHDPDDARGRGLLATADRLVERANRTLVRGEGGSADELFERAAAARNAVWGSRLRNLLFDHHSVGFLSKLGVDMRSLPRLRQLDTHLGPGQPSIFIRYGDRESGTGNGRLDAATLIAQRDPVVAASIGDVERVLRRAVDRNPNVVLSYDAPAVSIRQHDAGVSVDYGRRGIDTLRGSLLVIADGGGRRSLSRRLGIGRIDVGYEAMNIAAFQCDPDAELLGHRLDEAWLDARTTEQGWVVFLNSGAGRLTVNTRRVVGADAPTALELAIDSGAAAPLADKPADVRYALDRAERVVDGDATVLVGDAACRASPIWAFGAQFGLLWAQMVADLIGDSVGPGGPPSLESLRLFADEAERVSKMRLEFESSVIKLVDLANANVRSVSDITMSQNLVAAVDRIELNFEAAGPTGGRMALKLGVDLDRLISASDKPDLAAFCAAVGRFNVEGLLNLHYDGDGGGAASSSEAQPLDYRTNLERVRLQGGNLTVRRVDAGYWTFCMRGVDLHRNVDKSGSASVAAIERAELRLPDAFVTEVLQRMGPQLWALGATKHRPMRFEFELEPGKLELGDFELRLSGAPLVCMILSRRRGSSHFRFQLLRGSAVSRNFSAVVRNTRLGATRVLRAGQSVFGRIADPFIDWWASGASIMIRRVDFTMNANGSGKATYYFLGVPFPVRMNKDDVEQLIAGLFRSESCERIMRQYQTSVRAARISPTTPP